MKRGIRASSSAEGTGLDPPIAGVTVSTGGDIKVRLRETTPNPAEQDDLGELTWEISLDGGQTATIRHRFAVEHPAQVTIAGL